MHYVRCNDVASFRFGDLQIRDLTAQAISSASVACVEVAPGVAHDLAKSTKSDKFYVCIAGALVFEVNERRVELGPLDLLVVERDEWFAYRNEGEETATLLLVHVPSFDSESEVFRT